MSNTTGKLYQKEDSPTKTSSDTKKVGQNIVETVCANIDDMQPGKLFFILLVSGYCVISFSKGKTGVTKSDLWHYILFVLFSLSIYAAIYFFEERFGNNRRDKSKN